MIRAISLSEQGMDLVSASQLLDKLQSDYPGELFFLEEDMDSEGKGATVSWIPSWYIQQTLAGMFYNALWQGSPSLEHW